MTVTPVAYVAPCGCITAVSRTITHINIRIAKSCEIRERLVSLPNIDEARTRGAAHREMVEQLTLRALRK